MTIIELRDLLSYLVENDWGDYVLEDSYNGQVEDVNIGPKYGVTSNQSDLLHPTAEITGFSIGSYVPVDRRLLP